MWERRKNEDIKVIQGLMLMLLLLPIGLMRVRTGRGEETTCKS